MADIWEYPPPRVLFLLTVTRAVVGFSRLLEQYIRKFQAAKNTGILAVRTQLNAALAQLNKKLRMDDFLTIATTGNQSVL